MQNEVWKSVIDYNDLYEVSNLGRVKSLERKVVNRSNFIKERIMKTTLTKNGYLKVVLNNQKPSTKLVHRLVAQAFIPNPQNKACVNHIDCDKTNNNVENLEWATHSENNSLPYLQGRKITNLNILYGENHPNSKLTKEDIINIKQMYKPYIFTSTDISKLYNVHRSTIVKILSNKTYKNAKV